MRSARRPVVSSSAGECCGTDRRGGDAGATPPARDVGGQVGWDCGVDCCVERMQSLRAIGVHVAAWYTLLNWCEPIHSDRECCYFRLLFPANRPLNRPAPTKMRQIATAYRV